MKTLMSAAALAAGVMAAPQTWANTTTTAPPAGAAPAPTSTTNVKTVAPTRFFDKVTASVAATLNGPSVASVTGNSAKGNRTSKTVDAQGNATRDIFSDTTVRIGYQLTDAVNVSANSQFNYTPVKGGLVQFLDPYVRIAHSRLLTGPVTLAGDFRFYIPVSNGAIASNRIFGIRNTLSASYTVPGTRFTLGTDTILRGRFYAAGTGESESLLAYLSPNATYQITPTLAATLFAEFAATSQAKTGLLDMANGGSAVGPGISWDITPSVNVNPFLVFQSMRINPESTVFAMNFTARLL